MKDVNNIVIQIDETQVQDSIIPIFLITFGLTSLFLRSFKDIEADRRGMSSWSKKR